MSVNDNRRLFVKTKRQPFYKTGYDIIKRKTCCRAFLSKYLKKIEMTNFLKTANQTRRIIPANSL